MTVFTREDALTLIRLVERAARILDEIPAALKARDAARLEKMEKLTLLLLARIMPMCEHAGELQAGELSRLIEVLTRMDSQRRVLDVILRDTRELAGLFFGGRDEKASYDSKGRKNVRRRLVAAAA